MRVPDGSVGETGAPSPVVRTASGDAVSFAAELKRRKVLRVAVAYFFTAVAVLEAAQALMSSRFLPSSLFDTLVAIVLIGFPVAMFLAWFFEVAGGSIRREKPADAAVPAPSGLGTKALRLARFWIAASRESRKS